MRQRGGLRRRGCMPHPNPAFPVGMQSPAVAVQTPCLPCLPSHPACPAQPECRTGGLQARLAALARLLGPAPMPASPGDRLCTPMPASPASRSSCARLSFSWASARLVLLCVAADFVNCRVWGDWVAATLLGWLGSGARRGEEASSLPRRRPDSLGAAAWGTERERHSGGPDGPGTTSHGRHINRQKLAKTCREAPQVPVLPCCPAEPTGRPAARHPP